MAKDNKKLDIKLENVPSQQILQDSLTNERRFLALLFKTKKHLESAIASGISYEYFINHNTKQIFKTMAEYYDQFNALLQADTFEAKLRQRVSTPEEVGKWMEEYHQIVRQIVDDNDFEYLRKTICDNQMHRYGYTVARKYLDAFLNAKSDQSKLVMDFQQDVSNIGLPNDPTKVRHMSLSDALGGAMEELKDRAINPSKYIGVRTGFECIDKSFVGGFAKGNYVVIAGVPNGGKTTFMFNLARNIAKQKLNVVYVTVETDIESCTRRFFSIEALIGYNVIMRGGQGVDGLNDTTLKEFEKACDRMRNDIAPYFHWVEIPYKTPWSMIQNRLRQLMSYTTIDVLFIDYLNCIGREVSFVGRPDLELADVSSRVQNFGKANKILTFTAQQMKTDKIRELGKKPEASKEFHTAIGDLSGTKEIESDADTIFSVWIDQETKQAMYLRSTKARYNKNQEKFTLAYEPDSGRVYNMPSQDEFGNVADNLANNPAFVKAVATPPPVTSADITKMTLWGDPGDPNSTP